MQNNDLNNPLLSFEGLPCFSQIKPEHIVPAVTECIACCRHSIEQVCSSDRSNISWGNSASLIEDAEDKLSRVWAVVSHLNAVANTPEIREAHDECLPLLSDYHSWAGQNKALFEVFSSLKESSAFSAMNCAQQKSIENSIRDFKLSGVHLPQQKQDEYKAIVTELSQLESRFANNVLDATDSFFLHVSDEKRTGGLPSGSLSLARAEAERRKLDGYVFTLKAPSYVPFMTYADDRELRRTMYLAHITRASEIGPDAAKFDNTELMQQIIALRHKKAQLLGFSNYAEYSLATKMAESTSQVFGFLNDLAEKCKAKAEDEFAELQQFARENGFEPSLEPWDISYWSEKLRQSKYSYNAEELRRYFPLDHVLSGLFECAKRLYGITLTQKSGVDIWNPAVTCYDVTDKFGSHIGVMYFDLYARNGKQGGAWMDECISRRFCADCKIQLPVTFIVCNFTQPLSGRKCELTHDEVLTLFHEFGHGLNQILTKVDVADVSGINGVCWDVVELPSQFNENFAWQKEVLEFLASHSVTGATIPDDKLQNLMQSRIFHSALAMMRQLEFAIFDFKLHAEYHPDSKNKVVDVLNSVRKQVRVVPLCAEDRFANAFTHIFSGGYSAGYYSYKWAEVLAADAFSRFAEEGILNAKTGQEFMDEILAVGGVANPMQSFIAFRGRAPKTDALLLQEGIITKN